LNHLDLFSGIGGFSLGLKRVFNIKHSYFSEIDKYAIDVYKHNFKNSTYVKSVTDIRGGDLPRIDVITFGSPCQDFSLAGKRKGMDGERSSLITEAIRLIKECRPSFFIWENVKGTFSSNSGEDFWAIIQAFTNIGGYRLEWQLLNTKWFLPQNRERIYLVGCLGEGSGKQIFPITENSKKINELQGQQANICTLTTRYEAGGNGSYIIERELDAQEEIKVRSATKSGYEIAKVGDAINYTNINSYIKRGRVGKQSAQTLDTNCCQAVITEPLVKPTQIGNSKKFGNAVGKHNQDAFTLRSANPNGVILNQSTIYDGYNNKVKEENIVGTITQHCSRSGLTNGFKVINKNSIRRLTPIECERLQGFPDNWTRHGQELGEISDSQRYKMCGNAVTVDVVEAVAKKIKESL
jgi:DNA (cytosine-5)-methyltransferase 1